MNMSENQKLNARKSSLNLFKLLLLTLLLLTIFACQKKQLDLAEAKPVDDAPEYTVEADVNIPGGTEIVKPEDQKPTE